jgi:hypothetical protein
MTQSVMEGIPKWNLGTRNKPFQEKHEYTLVILYCKICTAYWDVCINVLADIQALPVLSG